LAHQVHCETEVTRTSTGTQNRLNSLHTTNTF